MQHRISAGVIVEDAEGRVLVVHHVLSGRYDFWVAPGGGVQGTETLQQAAAREAREECGLDVDVGELLYIEELLQPELRLCKFWFSGRVVGGTLSTAAPEALAESITEAAWLARGEMEGKTVFPPELVARTRPAAPLHLGLREMAHC